MECGHCYEQLFPADDFPHQVCPNCAHIADLIDEWHDGHSLLSLHEYLGMTWEEYIAWLSD